MLIAIALLFLALAVAASAQVLHTVNEPTADRVRKPEPQPVAARKVGLT